MDDAVDQAEADGYAVGNVAAPPDVVEGRFYQIGGPAARVYAARLDEWLTAKNIPCATVHAGVFESSADALRRASQRRQLTPMMEALIQASDELWRYESLIAPKLREGMTVLVTGELPQAPWERLAARGLEEDLAAAVTSRIPCPAFTLNVGENFDPDTFELLKRLVETTEDVPDEDPEVDALLAEIPSGTERQRDKLKNSKLGIDDCLDYAIEQAESVFHLLVPATKEYRLATRAIEAARAYRVSPQNDTASTCERAADDCLAALDIFAAYPEDSTDAASSALSAASYSARCAVCVHAVRATRADRMNAGLAALVRHFAVSAEITARNASEYAACSQNDLAESSSDIDAAACVDELPDRQALLATKLAQKTATKAEAVEYAVYCAESGSELVQKYCPDDTRCADALSAVRRWLSGPSEASQSGLRGVLRDFGGALGSAPRDSRQTQVVRLVFAAVWCTVAASIYDDDALESVYGRAEQAREYIDDAYALSAKLEIKQQVTEAVDDPATAVEQLPAYDDWKQVCLDLGFELVGESGDLTNASHSIEMYKGSLDVFDFLVHDPERYASQPRKYTLEVGVRIPFNWTLGVEPGVKHNGWYDCEVRPAQLHEFITTFKDYAKPAPALVEEAVDEHLAHCLSETDCNEHPV